MVEYEYAFCFSSRAQGSVEIASFITSSVLSARILTSSDEEIRAGHWRPQSVDDE